MLNAWKGLTGMRNLWCRAIGSLLSGMWEHRLAGHVRVEKLALILMPLAVWTTFPL